MAPDEHHNGNPQRRRRSQPTPWTEKGRAAKAWALAKWAALSLLWVPAFIVLWPDRPYPIDLFSHFAFHYACLQLLAIAALCACRRWKATANAIGAFLILIALMRWNATPPVGMRPLDPGAHRVKVVHYNAYSNHSRHDEAFASWLEIEDPDIVVIVDTPWRYVDAHPWLAERYPYRIEPRPQWEWPNVLLSKFPMEDAELIDEVTEDNKFSFIARRSVVLTLPNGARTLLTATHPPSPRFYKTWRSSLRSVERDGRLLGDWAASQGLPILVAGDFNSSPTGAVHSAFRAQSGLTGWSPLWGAGTWPSWLPPWLATPIDRIWTSADVRVLSIDVGPRFLSDHRPLIAIMDFPPPK